MKGAPFNPERCCRKRTGPGENSLIKIAHRQHHQWCRHNQQDERAEEIHELLDQSRPGGFGRGAENQQGASEQFVEARARNLRGEKVGEEPDLDAFEFANLDDVLYLLEIGVLAAQDHAVDGVVVEQLDELCNGVGQIELRDDGNGFIFAPLQFPAHAGGFLFRADEDEAAFVLALRKPAFERQPQHFFLAVNQCEADEAEKRRHTARHDQGLLKKKSHQNQDNRRQQATFEQWPHNGVARAEKGAIVKTLRFKQKGRGNHCHRDKKSIFI